MGFRGGRRLVNSYDTFRSEISSKKYYGRQTDNFYNSAERGMKLARKTSDNMDRMNRKLNIELALKIRKLNMSDEQREAINKYNGVRSVSLLFNNKNYNDELTKLEKDGYEISYKGKYGITLTKYFN